MASNPFLAEMHGLCADRGADVALAYLRRQLHSRFPALGGKTLEKIKHVSNTSRQATTWKFSDKFCPWCGETVKNRRPDAIFCSSGCLKQFHRDRKCGAVPIKRRPKRRRLL